MRFKTSSRRHRIYNAGLLSVTCGLGVYLLTGCTGHKTLLGLTAQCDQFGQNVAAEDACQDDESAAQITADCHDFIEQAEEYDCGEEGEDVINCLVDTDVAEICEGQDWTQQCPSEVSAFQTCLGA